MGTAIIRTFTTDGTFIIAADGLEASDGEPPSKPPNEFAEKIFKIENKNWIFAGALSGASEITYLNSDETFLNIYEEFKRSSKLLPQATGSIHSLVARLMNPIKDVITKSQESGLMDDLPGKSGDVFTTIFLEGFFKKEPHRIRIDIGQTDQIVMESDPDPFDLKPKSGLFIPEGSSIITDGILSKNNLAFSRYWRGDTGLSEVEAINASKDYIACCIDTELSKLDPVMCPKIGGRVHIAKVSLADGFKWIIPPLSSSG